MNPLKPLASHVLRDHVLFGAVVAALLIPVWGTKGSLIFWCASILIDLDHYLHFLYVAKGHGWTPWAMFRYHEQAFDRVQREDVLILEIFHTAEFMLAAALAAYLWFPSLKPAVWGGVFHLGVDLAHLARYRMMLKRAHSLIEFWLRTRKTTF